MKRTCFILGAAVVTVGAALAAPLSSEIDRFSGVNEQVRTGAQPTPEQLASLKADGIRGIINLRELEQHNIEEEAALAKARVLAHPRPIPATAPRAGEIAGTPGALRVHRGEITLEPYAAGWYEDRYCVAPLLARRRPPPRPAQAGMPASFRRISVAPPFLTSRAMIAGLPSNEMREPSTSTWSRR
jgi:hypothetical protein